MEFSLKCNSLKCRAQLLDRAVVTTCSHIFCETCSEQLGLLDQRNQHKTCPACQTTLNNPDDAVSCPLNPSEDYKTSVLSGLSPTTIVECAGRGLAFWSYQCTQEIVYQEYLAKTLTDKYQTLNVQVDKIINEANTEIEGLNQKLNQLQIEQDKLRTDNATLASALRERARKHQQVQELYDRLKRKEMTAATQSAAFESVDEVLQAAAQERAGRGRSGHSGGSGGEMYAQYPDGRRIGTQRMPGHGIPNVTGDRMMPPPLSRMNDGIQSQGFRLHQDPVQTPQHRIRLGGGLGGEAPGTLRQPTALGTSQRFTNGLVSHTSTLHRPASDQPSYTGGLHSRAGTGYGLSAGMRTSMHQPQDRYRVYR